MRERQKRSVERQSWGRERHRRGGEEEARTKTGKVWQETDQRKQEPDTGRYSRERKNLSD